MTGSANPDTIEQRLRAALHVLAETQIPVPPEHSEVIDHMLKKMAG